MGKSLFLNPENKTSYANDSDHRLFYGASNIEKNFIQIKKDLSNCLIQTFFLHSPTNAIISDKFIDEYINFCNLNKLIPGISNVEDDLITNLITKYKKVTFQMSLLQYLKFEEKIEENQNMIQINSIFRSKDLQNKISKENYERSVFEYFKNNNNIKLVLGINSEESVKNLIKNSNFLY